MVELHVKTQRCELSPADQRGLDRYRERLDRRLRHFDPDLVHLTIEIDRHPRTGQYVGSFRLTLLNQALPAKRNSGPTIEALLKQAFDDIEEQLSRFKSNLRRDYAHERKRASLPPEAIRYQERELMAERELLDRALAGDRTAFDTLINDERPGLSTVIASELVARGQEPRPETIDHVMADVLTTAFRDLARKPARWSFGGWLAWLARRQLQRESKGHAVAQSAE